MTADRAPTETIEVVVSVLRNALPLLKRWQERIATGQQAP